MTPTLLAKRNLSWIVVVIAVSLSTHLACSFRSLDYLKNGTKRDAGILDGPKGSGSDPDGPGPDRAIADFPSLDGAASTAGEAGEPVDRFPGTDGTETITGSTGGAAGGLDSGFGGAIGAVEAGEDATAGTDGPGQGGDFGSGGALGSGGSVGSGGNEAGGQGTGGSGSGGADGTSLMDAGADGNNDGMCDACDRNLDGGSAADVPPAGEITIKQIPERTSVDLTAEGTIDWTHWGATTVQSFDHRRAGGGKIGNLLQTPDFRYVPYPVTYTWSDGTPSTTGSTTTGVYNAGSAAKLSLRVGADDTIKTLRLYVGANVVNARLTAHLSDGSAPDATFDATGSGLYEVPLEIRFRAGSPEQTLALTWMSTSMAVSAAVSIKAATLF